jgi:hypothetical protein
MQEQELLNDEKQKEHDGQAPEEQVLQTVPEAHDAQGDKGVGNEILSPKRQILDGFMVWAGSEFGIYQFRISGLECGILLTVGQ